ncbi:hypothetical protein GCM10027159_34500 [Lysobacter terrae]
MARAAKAPIGGKALGLHHLRRMGIGADVVRVDRKLDRVEAESLMRQIAADPDVEYVTVDRRLQAMMSPNDPMYANQWDLFGTYGILADQAWDVTQGAGVVVAVIDTGITNHSDLNANILPGYDFITDPAVANDGDGRDSDPSDPGDFVVANQCGNGSSARNSSWHGTHVTGTVAALTNNANGIAGVAYAAKVVPVRVLGSCGGDTSDIADAIVWASGGSVAGEPDNANPAEVINMSLGGQEPCDTVMQSAIDIAVSNGTTVVVAAGNSNADISGFTPASCKNVIAVGATTNTGARATFSNWGSPVDIAAPGTNILSTLNSGTTSPVAETYGKYQGTSMSAPHVAGVAALIQAVAPIPKTPAQVEDLIKCTATGFPSTPSMPIGAGILNAQKAALVAEAVPQSYSSAMGPWSTGPVSITPGSTVVQSLKVSGPGNASCNTQIFVNLNHPNPGILQVDLIAPTGAVYHLGSGLSFGPSSLPTFLNLSNEPRSGFGSVGTWKLRVTDTNPSGVVTGSLIDWSISFN